MKSIFWRQFTFLLVALSNNIKESDDNLSYIDFVRDVIYFSNNKNEHVVIKLK